MSRDKRKHPRTSMRHAGSIRDSFGETLAHFVTVDISAGGAQLKLSSEPDLPRRFIVHLSSNGSVRRVCEIAWRNGNRVGVRFVAPGVSFNE